MMHCVQCKTELVAPERSEYWSDSHACHILAVPYMQRLFRLAGLVSY